MNICYRGNHSPRHSTENHIGRTLELMGHQVTRIQEDVVGWPETLEACERADLFLFTSTFGYAQNWPQDEAEAAIQTLRGLLPTASFHLDLYAGLNRQDQLTTNPFWHAEWMFTADGDPVHAELFRSLGIKHHWIRPGVFAPECYEGTFDPQYQSDVAFVGSWRWYHDEWRYRLELARFLKRTYRNRLGLWPHANQPAIRNDDLNNLYASVKVVVGDSCNPGFKLKNYFSDRLFETLGRGGFLIHPWVEGIEDELKDHEHIVLYPYGDFTRLRELVDHFVADDEHRETIRKAGHEQVKNHCTYTHRMQEMLDVLKAEGAL